MTRLTLRKVDELAAKAHEHQVDRVGVPYVEHVRAVADALLPLGEELAMAGLLHDILEDTPWTANELLEAGVPAGVVATVTVVTKVPGMPYEEMVLRVAAEPWAALVKIADNAHNCHPVRTAALDPKQRARFAAKYAAARAVLWPAVDQGDLRTILARVNPSLLAELPVAGPAE